MNKKRCSYCKTLKSSSEFHKNTSRYDGLQAYCKKCRTFLNRKNRFDREKLECKKLISKGNNKKHINEISSKKCRKCNITKPINEFSFIKSRSYYKSVCKSCAVIAERERIINKIREGLL